MRGAAKRLIVWGLDRALGASGVPGADVPLARRDVVDWGFARARATRNRLGIVGGLAVVVTRPARAELRAVDVPTAGPEEVTVEVLASAISPGTERAQWLRLPNARPPLPFVPGYSAAGRVLHVGSGAGGVTPGELVAVLRARHASVITVPASWAVPVPDGVPVEHAALAYLAVIAGYGVRRAGSLAGEPVCVVGAGPVGALAHRLAMLEKPGPVTVVAASTRREAAAMRAGAARFLTAAEGAAAAVDASVVIEATGDPEALETAVSAARPGATVVLLGSPRGVTSVASLAAAQRKGLRVVGAHVSALATEARRGSADPFREIAERFLGAVAAGHVDACDLAGEGVDPREIALAYRRLGRGELSAAHLDWSRLGRTERVRKRGLLSPPRLRPRAPSLPAPATPAGRPTGSSLRFAVLGCGDIGFTNARAIAAADGAEVAVAYDVVSGLAGAVVDQFGGLVATSLEEALDPGRVDAVFISTPHDLHVPLAIRAAEAGLHVIVEKPLATDLAAAEEAVAVAAAAGVELSTCFSFRYGAAVRLSRDLVERGALGALRGATVLFHADKPQSYWLGGFSGRAASDWRTSRARAGGGVLIMNLTHYVDLLRYIAGAEAESVAGWARTDEEAEVEDAVALSVGFRGGAIGTFSGSASTRGTPEVRFEIWGDTGTLRMAPEPAIYTERAVDAVTAGEWCRLAPGTHEDERRVFVERFAQAIRDGRSPDVTPGDALAVQAFIDAAYRAVDTGRRVTLGPTLSDQ